MTYTISDAYIALRRAQRSRARLLYRALLERAVDLSRLGRQARRDEIMARAAAIAARYEIGQVWR